MAVSWEVAMLRREIECNYFRMRDECTCELRRVRWAMRPHGPSIFAACFACSCLADWFYNRAIYCAACALKCGCHGVIVGKNCRARLDGYGCIQNSMTVREDLAGGCRLDVIELDKTQYHFAQLIS